MGGNVKCVHYQDFSNVACRKEPATAFSPQEFLVKGSALCEKSERIDRIQSIQSVNVLDIENLIPTTFIILTFRKVIGN